MGRCDNCGEYVKYGAFCAACGLPINQALNAIRQKVRSVRHRSHIAKQWMWRGAKTGFVVGFVLSIILSAILEVRHVVSPPPQETMLDVLGFSISFFVFLALLFMPLIFAFFYLISDL